MFTLLPDDVYVSPSFNPVWAKIDNYQIYSLIIDDCNYNTTLIEYQQGFGYGAVPGYLAPIQYFGSVPYTLAAYPITSYLPRVAPYNDPVVPRRLYDDSSVIDVYVGDSIVKSSRVTAFQTFSPLGKITFDFAELAKAFPVQGVTKRIWYSSVRKIQGWAEDPRPNYQNLYSGFMTDGRIKPSMIKCTATSTREIKWGYYRRNPNEDHPTVGASLDWHQGMIKAEKNQPYTLPIIDPVLGTLVVDSTTKDEILAAPGKPNHYPHAYLFRDAIASLMAYWESIRVNTTPPSLPSVPHVFANSFYSCTVYHIGGDQVTFSLRTVAGPAARYSQRPYIIPSNNPNDFIVVPSNVVIADLMVTPGSPITRIVAATNDRWGHGTVTISENLPPVNHPVFDVNEYQLFEAPQLDDELNDVGFGTLTMDSPRILEIHAALEAAKYAVNELDPEVPRVTTLGYWIEKTGNLLGHRPNALGEIDHAQEKAKYARQRIANPQWGKSQYSLNQFGKRGLVVPHLPNTYANGKLQKLYDVVYDIPQLLQALHDQVDIAQGIQHGSQIRVKLADGAVQSFPDLLALQIETLKIASSMRESVNKTQISTAVTGAEVRELFGAIGTPVAQKYLTLKDSAAKKSVQIPYFGHQQGKESVTAGLSTLKINQAIALGVLMPKAQPAKSKINPFTVLKKKN